MHDTSLQPGRDYYVDEAGRLVFTAQYHLARGYCCGNGCRHCPYHDDACTTGESATFDFGDERHVENNN